MLISSSTPVPRLFIRNRLCLSSSAVATSVNAVTEVSGFSVVAVTVNASEVPTSKLIVPLLNLFTELLSPPTYLRVVNLPAISTSSKSPATVAGNSSTSFYS